jgi:hypothetical protein
VWELKGIALPPCSHLRSLSSLKLILSLLKLIPLTHTRLSHSSNQASVQYLPNLPREHPRVYRFLQKRVTRLQLAAADGVVGVA